MERRNPLSPRQIQHRRRVHAKGRKHFLLYTGVAKFGGLLFISTLLWEWYDQFNWHIPPATLGLLIYTSFVFLVSIAMGYLWAHFVWNNIYSKAE